jgi:hypothetical protein
MKIQTLQFVKKKKKKNDVNKNTFKIDHTYVR